MRLTRAITAQSMITNCIRSDIVTISTTSHHNEKETAQHPEQPPYSIYYLFITLVVIHNTSLYICATVQIISIYINEIRERYKEKLREAKENNKDAKDEKIRCKVTLIVKPPF